MVTYKTLTKSTHGMVEQTQNTTPSVQEHVTPLLHSFMPEIGIRPTIFLLQSVSLSMHRQSV